MRSLRSSVRVYLAIGIVVVFCIVLFSFVINAMTRPVYGSTVQYTADFTDVAGLHVSGDVRVKGLAVGKVEKINLVRRDTGTIAVVGFSLDSRYPLTNRTTVSVKYQNLTGNRYLDVDLGSGGREIRHIPVQQTRASYDITQLFNGLQPVLTTMRTADVNRFMDNLISVIQGDGSGLQPLLESVQKLSDYANDRETVISALVTNVSKVADSMGGRSPQVVQFLADLKIAMSSTMTILPEFQKTAMTGPPLLGPVFRIVDSLGLSETVDIDTLIKRVFKSSANAIDIFRLVPGTFAGMQMPKSVAGGCSKGRLEPAPLVGVLMNGSEVVLCKP